MVARRRLKQSLKELGFGLGVFVFYTAGLPLLLTFVGYDWHWLSAARMWGLRFLVLVPALVLVGLWWRWREIVEKNQRLQARLEGEGRSFYLLPRADAPPVRPDRVGLWSRVGEVLPRDEHLAWEVIGGEEGVRFALRTTPGVDRAMLTQIMAEWPGTQVRPLAPEEDPLSVTERPGWWCELRPQSAERPIVSVSNDPLRALLAELSRLPRGVRGGVQVLVRGDPYTRQHVGGRAAKASYQQVKNRSKYHLPTTAEERRRVQSLDERAQRSFVEVRLRVWAMAGGEEMARSVARSLARALLSQYGPINPLRQVKEGAGVPTRRDFPAFAGRPWTDVELGALLHLVGQDVRPIAPQLAYAPANPLPPSPACRVPKGVRLSSRLRPSEDAPLLSPDPTATPSLWLVEEVPG